MECVLRIHYDVTHHFFTCKCAKKEVHIRDQQYMVVSKEKAKWIQHKYNGAPVIVGKDGEYNIVTAVTIDILPDSALSVIPPALEYLSMNCPSSEGFRSSEFDSLGKRTSSIYEQLKEYNKKDWKDRSMLYGNVMLAKEGTVDYVILTNHHNIVKSPKHDIMHIKICMKHWRGGYSVVLLMLACKNNYTLGRKVASRTAAEEIMQLTLALPEHIKEYVEQLDNKRVEARDSESLVVCLLILDDGAIVTYETISKLQ